MDQLIGIAIAIGGAFVGVHSRLPAGALLVPLLIGLAGQPVAKIAIDLPPPALTMAYTFVGWAIGSRFDRQLLTATFRSAPKGLGAIVLL